MDKVLVDASLSLRWVMRKKLALTHCYIKWATSLTQMLVPPLFLPEVTNALYLSVRRQRLTLEEAKLALEAIMHIGVGVTEPPELYSRGLDVAALEREG